MNNLIIEISEKIKLDLILIEKINFLFILE